MHLDSEPAGKGRNKKAAILIALITLLSGIIVWQFVKYRLVNNAMKKNLSKKSKGLYQISYDHLVIDELAGTLSARNIEISSDSSVYDSLSRTGNAPALVFHLKIPSILISGVKTPKALLGKEISGRILEMENPEVEIFSSQPEKDRKRYPADKELYKQILGNLKSIQIDSLQLLHATVSVKDMRTKSLRYRGNDFTVLMTDILVDSTQKYDSSRMLFAKNLLIAGERFSLPAKTKDYRFEFNKIGFNSRLNRFTLGSFRIIPMLSEEDFATANHFSKDRFNITIENIRLDSVDLEALWNRRLIARNFYSGKSSVYLFRDISHPHDSVIRVGKYPQQLVEQLPVQVMIEEMEFRNSYIEYKEKNAKSDSSGKVRFETVQARISNLTNIHAFIARKKDCRVHFRSKFLGLAPLQAVLMMNLASKKGDFNISGHMDSIQAKVLNQLLNPMALANLDGGTIDKLDFDLNCDNYHSNGRLIILYHDLSVTLLKKDDKKNKYRTKFLPTLLGKIILKRSNPSEKGDAPRMAEVKYDRDVHRSMFHLIWKSIFTGVKKTAGMQ